ncbi:four helix bundle protein [uncultured Legionella sp.]|uniref:four helix bundle protein n=1 Tax=uncultured Legionella sp. TaxID=210934 RepID=UPI00261E3ED8|nr:four helix bundle protein [uncultured Legionella sp.]
MRNHGPYPELPVYHDSYQLSLRIFECCKEFPREYKFTLGQDMKRDVLHLLRTIYRANKAKDKGIYMLCSCQMQKSFARVVS